MAHGSKVAGPTFAPWPRRSRDDVITYSMRPLHIRRHARLRKGRANGHRRPQGDRRAERGLGAKSPSLRAQKAQTGRKPPRASPVGGGRKRRKRRKRRKIRLPPLSIYILFVISLTYISFLLVVEREDFAPFAPATDGKPPQKFCAFLRLLRPPPTIKFCAQAPERGALPLFFGANVGGEGGKRAGR